MRKILGKVSRMLVILLFINIILLLVLILTGAPFIAKKIYAFEAGINVILIIPAYITYVIVGWKEKKDPLFDSLDHGILGTGMSRSDGERSAKNPFYVLATVWAVLIIPALFLPMFSVFMYDDPGSGGYITDMLAFSLWTAPISLFFGAIDGFFGRGVSKPFDKSKSILYNIVHFRVVFAPLLSGVLFVVAFILNVVVCFGRFDC